VNVPVTAAPADAAAPPQASASRVNAPEKIESDRKK